MSDIGTRIHALRKTRNISQKELGDTAEVDTSTISRIESGTTKPNSDTIARMAAFFQVSCDFIINGTETNENLSNDLSLVSPMEELNIVFSQLNQQNRHELMEITKLKLRLQNEAEE